MGLLDICKKKKKAEDKSNNESSENRSKFTDIPKVTPPEVKTSEEKLDIKEVNEVENKTSDSPEEAFDKLYVKTGIEGFDKLITNGIPRGSASLICGGPGSGKTLFTLNALINNAIMGKKCYYMSFEEREDRLRSHMHDFGWNPEELEAKGNLVIKRYDPFEITRSVEALMEKAKGELMIDVAPVVFPDGNIPEIVIIDSLSSIAAAFSRDDGYRTYIEQLFKLFEKMGVTSFFISEIVEDKLEKGGSAVEQFLADNVIIIYNIKKQNIRESAIEILKMRGTKFQKRIVAMQILSGIGVRIYPEQKVYGGTN